jgi:hypothetical protein
MLGIVMGVLIEISMIHMCRVFYERNNGVGPRFFFTAYVQLPNNEQFILDDSILPRLKRRLIDVLESVHLKK